MASLMSDLLKFQQRDHKDARPTPTYHNLPHSVL
jgi:hypothetical protein